MTTLTKVIGLSLTAIGLLAGFTIGWGSQPPGGQVITVCPQGPPTCQFSKVREAINAAADGALILISPGIYIEREGLTISKNVTLFGSEPRLVRLVTDRISIEESAQVMISGLTTQGRIRVYEAQATLVNVDVVGAIDVNQTEVETEQPPKHSQLTLISVYVLDNETLSALFIGPAAEAIVTTSELISSDFHVVAVTQNAKLVMSHSLIRGTYYLGAGVLAEPGATVWLLDTHIQIAAGPGFQGPTGSMPAGIAAYGGSDLVLQRIAISSTNHGILIGNTARLHMEASQVIAIKGWGVSLVIEPCGVRLPPTVNPSPQTFEGLVTGRQNEISGGRELGDVCPSALEFLKTAEGGQYP